MPRAEATCLAGDPVAVPGYLAETYWWAYVHPRAVRLFEREWLVNLILWGNFGRLRDAALNALGDPLAGCTLQIACVYGDLTTRLAARVAPGGRLDVVDVLPIQLDNLARKLPPGSAVGRYPALRAGPAHLRRVRRPNVDPFAFHRELNATHRPRRNQAQKLLIQLDISHGPVPP